LRRANQHKTGSGRGSVDWTTAFEEWKHHNFPIDDRRGILEQNQIL